MFKEEFNLENIEESKTNLDKLLKKSKKQLDELLKIENKSYENFVKPYEEIGGESISDFVTPIFHIDSVNNSEITQKVYEECLPLISNYQTEVSQNVYIFNALRDIQDKNNMSLTHIQNKVLENEIRDFKLSGCDLNNEKKDRTKRVKFKTK